MKRGIGEILLSEDEIIKRVRQLGRQISDDYSGDELTILCVLKGAVVFLADLLRNLEVPAELDFVQISSYGDGIESSGVVETLHDLSTEINGRHVLVVDDIVDSGLTLHNLRERLMDKQPASLKFCVLLDKSARRKRDVQVDYIGFSIPDEFIIGYGLDYAGKYRGLPYIAVLK